MTPKRLYIFEGVDGSGKTTLAKEMASRINGKYVHFGPMLEVQKDLGLLYIQEAMPAILGLEDVVFDRSWLSEIPYGKVMRGGKDRMDDESRSMLERILLVCHPLVVVCNPGIDAVLASFRKRRGEEYADKEEQIRDIHTLYRSLATDYTVYHYDYANEFLRAGFLQMLVDANPQYV